MAATPIFRNLLDELDELFVHTACVVAPNEYVFHGDGTTFTNQIKQIWFDELTRGVMGQVMGEKRLKAILLKG